MGHKKIFEYKIPWYQKFANRLDQRYRVALFIGGTLFLVFTPAHLSGIRNSEANYVKNNWLKDVLVSNDPVFTKLDEEKPPQPRRIIRV